MPRLENSKTWFRQHRCNALAKRVAPVYDDNDHVNADYPRFNLWIEADGQVVLSKWRVQLLQAVDQAGSISGAAEKMGFSIAWPGIGSKRWRTAWELGWWSGTLAGPRGGAVLTEAGREYVERFTRLPRRSMPSSPSNSRAPSAIVLAVTI